MVTLIQDFIPQNDNQTKAKKLIMDQFIDYKNKHEHTKNRIANEYKIKDSEDIYSLIENYNNFDKEIVGTPIYIQIKEYSIRKAELEDIKATSVSTIIFKNVLEPNGWSRINKHSHYYYIKDNKKYKPKEVIEYVIKILENRQDIIETLPRTNMFKKYFTFICDEPKDDKWVYYDSYLYLFIHNIIDSSLRNKISVAVYQIKNKPKSTVKKGYNEIDVNNTVKIYIRLDRENTLPLPENCRLMINNNTNKIKYINKDLLIEKTCSRCKLFHPYNEGSYCIECTSEFNKYYSETLRGKLLNLYKGARNDKRFKYTQEEPFITFDEFCLPFINSGGVSYYTQKPFIYENNNPRNISKERIKNNKGYIKDNVCFVERIMNISPGNNKNSDWNLQKIIKIKKSLEEEKNIKFDTDDFDEKMKLVLIDRRGRQGILSEEMTEYINRFKGILYSKIRSHLGAYDKKQFGYEGDMDIECILNLIKRLEGRCQISNKIFTYDKKTSEFAMSIDRIDNSQPHNKDNIRLVCKEFNVWGDLHWTKELFNELLI
tara:strand:+ start:7037 stop:8665 length:1629 start_codon:yes stop_codon:yes gene_type:complete